MRHKKIARLVLVALCGVIVSGVSWGQDEPEGIPPQPLTSALKDFAEQSGLQLVYLAQLTDGIESKGAAPDGTPEETLDQLLADTGLRYEFVNARTVSIEPMASNAEQEPGKSRPTSSQVMMAQTSAKKDRKTEEQNQEQQDRAGSKQRDLPIEEIVVTGTHIRGVHPESSALIVIGQEQMARSGVATVDQLLRQVPQNFSSLDQATFQANTGDIQVSANATRGATVDLRGLGAGATLTLVNGHRVASSGDFGAFVDVSMIPMSAIERVEVLTDGASALYGADAVAGVVNFILKEDFSGAETSVRYGRTWDAGLDERKVSQALGHSWSAGNAMLVYEYYDQGDLLTADRDYIPDQGGVFALIPGQERHSVFSTIRHDIAPGLEISAEGFYSDRRFEQDNTFFGFFLVEESGRAEAYGGAATVTKDLEADWAVSFTGNYATTRERRDIVFPPDPMPDLNKTNMDILEANLRADGPLWVIPGGDVRASIGLEAREDRFGDDIGDFSRRVNSAYGELFIPLIGRNNSVALAQRLELSLAGRYDDYGDVGSSSNPKVGVLWEPVASVRLRGTYGTSFRAPPLPQLRTDNDSFFVLGIGNPQGASLCPQPDPFPPAPCSITLVTASPWNPDLEPEESRSFTFGLDFTPARLPGLKASITYFDIEFEDRIASPPTSAGVFGIYSETDILAPFLDFSPDLAEVSRIFAEAEVLNLAGVGPEGVEVFFDGRLQNLAKTKTSGVDLFVNYDYSLGQNEFGLFGSASYLIDRSAQAASTTPEVDLVNKIYNPPRVRGRAGGTWTRGSLSSALTVNYTDSYQNNLVTPEDKISSWSTLDLQIAWHVEDDSAASLLHGLSVNLDVLNLTDSEPPSVSGGNNINLGFDPTNASPRGRFIAAQIRKRW